MNARAGHILKSAHQTTCQEERQEERKLQRKLKENIWKGKDVNEEKCTWEVRSTQENQTLSETRQEKNVNRWYSCYSSSSY